MAGVEGLRELKRRENISSCMGRGHKKDGAGGISPLESARPRVKCSLCIT